MLLLVTLGLFSFGVTLHEHYCSMDGKKISVFFRINHACSTGSRKIATCCESKEELYKKDCCSDNTKLVQWIPDAFSSAQHPVFLPITLFTAPRVPSLVVGQLKQLAVPLTTYRGPPKLTGKHRLILHQVFRI